ncbi:MAG: sulfatase [Planctomycetes bacterium]|nr:sulfatase [Planctomycetota bacterium]
MKRRLFILVTLFGLNLGLPLSAAEKPNILFIAIDDQNDWIGALKGHPQARTPNIDRLAQRGTLFTNAHCQSPLCNPSRTSLMTGLRPSTTGVYGLAPWFRSLDEYKDLVSLPQYLSRQGYRTYTTGKIYHGGYGRKKQDQEFQVIGPPPGVGVRPKAKLVNTPSNHPLMDWGVFPHRDEDKGDWKVAAWGIEQLKAKPKEPFFLSVGFFLPHVPCYATQKWFDLHPEESLILPPILRQDRADTPRFSWYLHWQLPEPRLKFMEEAGELKNFVRSYLACTSFIDSLIGDLIEALEASGRADNTLIVLWSDHGYHLGEKEITGKNTLWDRSTRVPLLFAGPGVTANARCSQPVELLDIYPTLLELCSLPDNDRLEGHSLAPQLRDAQAKRRWPAITTHNQNNHGIRTEDWRYIRYADGSEELYDMRKDPNEWRNLADDSQFTEILRDHRRWLPEKNVPPAPGSRHRILTYNEGVANWEDKDIDPKEPIPEI